MNLEIYGTLGPSCSERAIIEQLIQKGMTGMRLNLSHCNLDERKEWIDAFHDACKAQNQHLDLLIDMRGPELRTLDSSLVLWNVCRITRLYWIKRYFPI